MFENRLLKVWKHFGKWSRKQDIVCFRFYDHDLPEFPFSLELYQNVIHGAEYKRKHGMDDEAHQQWLDGCISVIHKITDVPPESVFLKQRQRMTGRVEQYEKFDERRAEKIVPEAGLSFIINLTDYLDSGLFLDHRITRGMVRAEAQGKRVLNLFCYTGSFSVYAAAGGAASVDSVDMSRTYIHWAKRNMQYNKLFDADKHRFIQEDVLQLIQMLEPDSYDLIVCDPPTFSNSKRMEEHFDVQQDHVALLKRLIRALAPGGSIYFSNNYRNFQLDRDAIPASDIKDITAQTTPLDFQGRLHRKCYLIRP